jgi:hypothetical protein
MLPPSGYHAGYLVYRLVREGVRMSVSYHRILLQTLLDDDLIGLVVNHIDGNKLNNRPSNLEAITHRANIQHAWRTGLMKAATGPRPAARGPRKPPRPKPQYVPSGFHGVEYVPKTGRYRARFKLAGRRADFGAYDSADEAAYVYDQVVSQLPANKRTNGLLV